MGSAPIYEGIIPDAKIIMQQFYPSSNWKWFTVDLRILRDNSLQSSAKKLIAIASVVIFLAGTLPLLTDVHGQGMSTQQLEDEIKRIDSAARDLRDQFHEVNATTQLLVAQQKVEAEWHREDQEFQSSIVHGVAAMALGIFLALLGWGLSQFGIVIGKRGK